MVGKFMYLKYLSYMGQKIVHRRDSKFAWKLLIIQFNRKKNSLAWSLINIQKFFHFFNGIIVELGILGDRFIEGIQTIIIRINVSQRSEETWKKIHSLYIKRLHCTLYNVSYLYHRNRILYFTQLNVI